MYSNEEEYVPFSGVFHCAGAVENYLCDLEKMMIDTLRDVLEAAKTSAEYWDLGETFKMRHEWLEDYFDDEDDDRMVVPLWCAPS